MTGDFHTEGIFYLLLGSGGTGVLARFFEFLAKVLEFFPTSTQIILEFFLSNLTVLTEGQSLYPMCTVVSTKIRGQSKNVPC